MQASTETIKLELTAIAPGGDAIGRHAGMVVFVPFGIPGEVVEIELSQRQRSFGRGRIVQVIDASPSRVTPHCPFVGSCGGCDWQHIDDQAQLEFKRAIVAEQLTRIGKLSGVDVRPCIASPQLYGYRNHARLAVRGDGRVGYRAERSHMVVAVDECPILEEPLNRRLHDLSQSRSLSPGDDLTLSVPMAPLRVGGLDYTVSPGAFFQVNTAVAALLVQEVLNALGAVAAAQILDLYCGVGLFTLPIASRGAAVTGVEASAVAADDARRNLAAFAKAAVINATVEQALRLPVVQQADWRAVVLDPPRAGVDGAALLQIAALKAERLVYVSCDPATLARDAGLLHANGYALAYAQPLDMFPQTHHVETVALFVGATG